jgi:cullin-associated NEDD8-dissociated protein 1
MLSLNNEGLRKRAAFCLGQLSVALNSKQLQSLIEYLIDRLRNNQLKKSDMLIQIQCIAQISRQVGNKLSSKFSDLYPLLAERAVNLLDINESRDLENQISEAALSAIENLIRKCPNEAQGQAKHIMKMSQTCLVYDPNYQYNDDDNDDVEMAEEGDGEGWGSDYYDEQADDDDDTAWKVRKSAIKVYGAYIASLPLTDCWRDIMQLLAQRFIERDDNVKIEILTVFRRLINQFLKQGETGSHQVFSP